MATNKFVKYYDNQKDDIDERLEEIIQEEPDDKELRQVLQETMKGGKRFRPTLTMLFFDLYDGEERRHALTHASVLEMIHLATLIHDDVIDYDKTRRGDQSLWNKLFHKSMEGLTKIIPQNTPKEMKPRMLSMLMSDNVLIGNGVATMGLKKLTDQPEVMKVVVEAIFSISQGAFREMSGYFRTKLFGTNDDDYVQVIIGKTAALFAVSTHVGSITADATAQQKEYSRQFGLNLGIAYQLADDIADGDVPNGVDAHQLLLDYANKSDEIADKLPDNQHTEILYDIVPYMVNKILRQEEHKEYIKRYKKGDFYWKSGIPP